MSNVLMTLPAGERVGIAFSTGLIPLLPLPGCGRAEQARTAIRLTLASMTSLISLACLIVPFSTERRLLGSSTVVTNLFEKA